jgi:hypothetical protein
MSPDDPAVTRAPYRTAVTCLLLVLMVAWGAVAQAQTTAFTTRAVGGVSIDAEGMLRNATLDEFGKLRQVRAEVLAAVPDGLDQAADMRTISLRRLNEAIRRCHESGKPLPAEMECLGGLLEIHYVLVYPEQNDIVLVGPAEAWKLDQRGAVVGAKTGRPVMLLVDLIEALRAAGAPVRSVITCSIDPTPEGLQRLQRHVGGLRTIGQPQATAMGIEQQLGPQKISVTGVPDTSHFARVMIGADYRMKRIGMGIEPAPVRDLPAFTQLMRASGRGMRNMLPRWWLAPDYEAVLRDADGLAWELRGSSVKTMTESDAVAARGAGGQAGRADPAAEKWAEIMTERYDQLALADPVFGQLRNCMDLAVVAALIVKEDLAAKAGASLPMLMDENGLETTKLPAPKQVESKATLARQGRNWMIACGGVEINPWAIVDKAQPSDRLATVRTEAAMDGQTERWWD